MAKRTFSTKGRRNWAMKTLELCRAGYLTRDDSTVIAAARFIGIDKAFAIVTSRPLDAMARCYAGSVTQ